MAEEIILGLLVGIILYYCILRPLLALGDISKELERIRNELRKIREENHNGSK